MRITASFKIFSCICIFSIKLFYYCLFHSMLFKSSFRGRLDPLLSVGDVAGVPPLLPVHNHHKQHAKQSNISTKGNHTRPRRLLRSQLARQRLPVNRYQSRMHRRQGCAHFRHRLVTAADVRAVFSVGCGLFEDKVVNVWFSLSVLVKLRERCRSPRISALILAVTGALKLTSVLDLLRRP